MSDQLETPPKPKVGSLRDRIKAFEQQQPAAPVPAPAPGPRPTRQWKPKLAEPPAQPSTASAASPTEPKTPGIHGGMSASDARDSIKAGGSLKDRMAALQGKGAFGPTGAPAPPVAAKPREWKKPVVSPAAVEGEHKALGEEDHVSATSPSAADEEAKHHVDVHAAPALDSRHESEHETVEHHVSPPADAESLEAAGDAQGGEHEKTEEELEAERRAAIAARMARLGGARLGMAPMFGAPRPKPPPKPVVHTHEVEGEHESTSEEPKHERIAVLPMMPKTSSPPVHEPEHEPEAVLKTESAELAKPKESEVTFAQEAPPVHETKAEGEEIHAPEEKHLVSLTQEGAHEAIENAEVTAETAPATSAAEPSAAPPKQHIAMPMPAAPRRAAPPRRNRGPLPLPPQEPEVVHEAASGAKEAETQAAHVSDHEAGKEGAENAEAEEPAHQPIAPAHEEVTLVETEHAQEEPASLTTDGEPEVHVTAELEHIDAHEEPSHQEAPTGVLTTSQTEPVEEAGQAAPEHEAHYAPETTEPVIAHGASSPHIVLSDEPGIIEDVEASPEPDETEPAAEEDEEVDERHQMAERMRKLGGVTFGMPVPAFPPKRGSTSSTEKHATTSPSALQPAQSALPADTHVVHDGPEDVVDKETAEVDEPQPLIPEHKKFPDENLEPPDHESPNGDNEYHMEEDIQEEKHEEHQSLGHHPTRSLPPPPPPPAAEPVSEDTPEELELEVAAVAHDEEEEDVYQEADEQVTEYHNHQPVEEDAEEAAAPALPPPVILHTGRPGRSLPPPPPSTVLPLAHPVAEEPVVHERHHDEELLVDDAEVQVTHADSDAAPLHVGMSQMITQQPLTEEETTNDESAKPAVVLVNTQALMYDDDEPDPIDPSFYSPPSRQTSSSSLPKVTPPGSNIASPVAATAPVTTASPPPLAPDASDESAPTEEDEELARRQTIAARMAKLGGLRFGLPPSLPPARNVPAPPSEESTVKAEAITAPEHGTPQLEDETAESLPVSEESEHARRQAILARLVAGGGRGFGMAPQLAPPAPPPSMPRSVTEDKLVDTIEPAEVGKHDDAAADAEEEEEEEEEEEVPPPPPPRPQRSIPQPTKLPAADSGPTI
ncbi:hypothetical protein DACRYDRAFT_21521, partial [Dacryopinax primogenitus]